MIAVYDLIDISDKLKSTRVVINLVLVRVEFLKTHRRAIVMMFVRPSVRPSVCLCLWNGQHCDHTTAYHTTLAGI